MNQAVPCARCGTSIQGAEIYFTLEAEAVCGTCNAVNDLHTMDVRAAHNIIKSARTALVFALMSFFINPFWVVTVIAISSGVYSLKSWAPDNQRFWQHVQAQRGLTIATAAIGIVIAMAAVSSALFGINLRVF